MAKVENVVAIVEARTGSSRLPGKVLMDICGKTLLERVIDRLKLAKTINQVVVATTSQALDDVVEQLCETIGISCFRGEEVDVLDRVYQTACHYRGDVVVQSGGDCPFYDPELIDLLVNILCYTNYAYACNDMKLTFPEGIDSHVIRFDALKVSAIEAKAENERSDTPRFIWNNPDRFSIFNLEAPKGSRLNRPEIRLTVDYPQDLTLCRKIYEVFKVCREPFKTGDIIKLFDDQPDLSEINRDCVQLTGAYL